MVNGTMDMNMSAPDNRRDTMDEQQFLTKLDRIKDIPTLPTIVFELNQLLRDPDTSILDALVDAFRIELSYIARKNNLMFEFEIMSSKIFLSASLKDSFLSCFKIV